MHAYRKGVSPIRFKREGGTGQSAGGDAFFRGAMPQPRVEAGLSQTEFGERCGFYQTYLSRIENGQANPTLNAMDVIASALGMTIYELWEYVRLTSKD